MSYEVQLKKSAAKALDDIPAYDREKILQALEQIVVQVIGHRRDVYRR